jgi:hypothetical protein
VVSVEVVGDGVGTVVVVGVVGVVGVVVVGVVGVVVVGVVVVGVVVVGVVVVGVVVVGVVVVVVVGVVVVVDEVFDFPVDGSSPNLNKINTAITDIKIKGIDIIIQDTIDMLFSHKMLSNNVTIIPIHILTNAKLYNL